MKTYLDCYPCFVRQALEGARLAGADEQQQELVLQEVLHELAGLQATRTPPETGYLIQRIVRRQVGGGDPYRVAKDESTRQALAMYPRLKEMVAQASDPLEVAIRLSIAGNIIDLGPVRREYDLWETVQRVLAEPLAVDHGPAFREALARADGILYLADNAGETVFDRVLIETLGVPVTYVVRGAPVLNDATLEDAHAAGLAPLVDLVSNGSDAAGTILRLCTERFRRLYEQAGMVIAKGQANYETLSEAGPRVFFLLQVKCTVVARDAGVPLGASMLKQG